MSGFNFGNVPEQSKPAPAAPAIPETPVVDWTPPPFEEEVKPTIEVFSAPSPEPEKEEHVESSGVHGCPDDSPTISIEEEVWVAYDGAYYDDDPAVVVYHRRPSEGARIEAVASLVEGAKSCFAAKCDNPVIKGIVGAISKLTCCNAHRSDLARLEDTLAEIRGGDEITSTPIGDPEFMWGGVRGEFGGMVGVFQRGDICALGAYSGVGKTTLVFTLAGLWASNDGGALMGLPVPGGRRVLIVTEAGKRQAQKLINATGLTKLEKKRLRVTHNLQTTSHGLRALVSKEGADIVILDSLTSIATNLGVHGKDAFNWTQPEHTTAVVGFLRNLQREFDLDLVMYLAHTKKNGGDGKFEDPTLEDVRGSGAIVEQAEWVGVIRAGDEKRPSLLKTVKSRDRGESIEKLFYRYDPQTGEYIRAEPDYKSANSKELKDRQAAEKSEDLAGPVVVVLFRNGNRPMSTRAMIAALSNLEPGAGGRTAHPSNHARLKAALTQLCGNGPLIAREDGKWSLTEAAFEGAVAFAATKGWDAEAFDPSDPLRDESNKKKGGAK